MRKSLPEPGGFPARSNGWTFACVEAPGDLACQAALPCSTSAGAVNFQGVVDQPQAPLDVLNLLQP